MWVGHLGRQLNTEDHELGPHSIRVFGINKYWIATVQNSSLSDRLDHGRLQLTVVLGLYTVASKARGLRRLLQRKPKAEGFKHQDHQVWSKDLVYEEDDDNVYRLVDEGEQIEHDADKGVRGVEGIYPTGDP